MDAAVVFYGAAPDAATMAKIKAPVLGLYGGDDPVVTPTINATKDAMGKAGKTYEPHVYEGATNAFMTYQAEGLNGQTTWWCSSVAPEAPVAIATHSRSTNEAR
mgnify:CR=1 FL=1